MEQYREKRLTGRRRGNGWRTRGRLARRGQRCCQGGAKTGTTRKGVEKGEGIAGGTRSTVERGENFSFFTFLFFPGDWRSSVSDW